MVALLDPNVLIALTITDHVHHAVAQAWWGGGRAVATCPITQGALLRFCLRVGVGVGDAQDLLDPLTGSHHHEFWPDDVAFERSVLDGITGHRQVTDAYLVALSVHHGGVLATLDRRLAERHGTAVELLRS